MKDVVSKNTRNQFREFLVRYSTLLEINLIFEGAGIELFEDFQPSLSGQRRNLVEQYYASLDFTSQSDISRLLQVFTYILESREAEQVPEEKQRLIRCLSLDSFDYIEGRFIFKNSVPSENTDSINSEVDSGIPPGIHFNSTKIFISYSHKDKQWLDRLQTHLKPLTRDGLIDPWDDNKIKIGDEWRNEIQQALLSAKIAILLVSADFLASNFIHENELPPLLTSAKERGTKIMSVILKPCLFERYEALTKYQAVNSPDKPLIDMTEGEQEAIWTKLAREIDASLR